MVKTSHSNVGKGGQDDDDEFSVSLVYAGSERQGNSVAAEDLTIAK